MSAKELRIAAVIITGIFAKLVLAIEHGGNVRGFVFMFLSCGVSGVQLDTDPQIHMR